MSTAGTGVVKPTVWSVSRPHFAENPLPAASAVGEKEEGYWYIARKARGKLRAAGPRTNEATTGNDTNSPTHSFSSEGDCPTTFSEKLRQQNHKFETPFEKVENLRKLKDSLKLNNHGKKI